MTCTKTLFLLITINSRFLLQLNWMRWTRRAAQRTSWNWGSCHKLHKRTHARTEPLPLLGAQTEEWYINTQTLFVSLRFSGLDLCSEVDCFPTTHLQRSCTSHKVITNQSIWQEALGEVCYQTKTASYQSGGPADAESGWDPASSAHSVPKGPRAHREESHHVRFVAGRGPTWPVLILDVVPLSPQQNN